MGVKVGGASLFPVKSMHLLFFQFLGGCFGSPALLRNRPGLCLRLGVSSTLPGRIFLGVCPWLLSSFPSLPEMHVQPSSPLCIALGRLAQMRTRIPCLQRGCVLTRPRRKNPVAQHGCLGRCTQALWTQTVAWHSCSGWWLPAAFPLARELPESWQGSPLCEPAARPPELRLVL